MAKLSAILYFLSHHALWAFPILIAISTGAGALLAAWRGSGGWLIGGVVGGLLIAQLNIFLSHVLNAWFLATFGIAGSAVIIDAKETSSQLNNRNIWRYDAVIRTADGRDVTTTFDTMSAAIHPIRNAILIPPVAQHFKVRYVPGFERNIVILSDESEYGKRRLLEKDRQLVEKARRQYEASPHNAAFIAGYRDALRTFIAAHRGNADDGVIRNYEDTLESLESTRAR